MNKGVMIGAGIAAVAIIIGILFGTGIINFGGETAADEKTIVIGKEKVISMEDLILEVSDFPDGWEVVSRGEKTKGDVSENSLALGWKKGYLAKYRDENNPDKQISLSISVYPEENINKVLSSYREEIILFDVGINGTKKNYVFDSLGDKYKIEGLSKVQVGDDSVALKLIYLDFNRDLYELNFIKEEYYIRLSGLDYELVKSLANKIDSKF